LLRGINAALVREREIRKSRGKFWQYTRNTLYFLKENSNK